MLIKTRNKIKALLQVYTLLRVKIQTSISYNKICTTLRTILTNIVKIKLNHDQIKHIIKLKFNHVQLLLKLFELLKSRRVWPSSFIVVNGSLLSLACHWQDPATSVRIFIE